MCDQKCNTEGLRFYDIAAILAEDDGKPHTINLCRNCFNLRLAERNESVVTNAKWKAMIEQKGLEADCRPPSGQMVSSKGCGTICSQKLVGKGLDGGGHEGGAAGEELASRVTVQGGA